MSLSIVVGVFLISVVNDTDIETDECKNSTVHTLKPTNVKTVLKPTNVEAVLKPTDVKTVLYIH